MYTWNPKAKHLPLPMLVSIGWFHFKLVGWGSGINFTKLFALSLQESMGIPLKHGAQEEATQISTNPGCSGAVTMLLLISLCFSQHRNQSGCRTKKKNKGWWKITAVIRESWKAPELEGPGICHDSFPHFYISLPADQRGVTRWNKVEQCSQGRRNWKCKEYDLHNNTLKICGFKNKERIWVNQRLFSKRFTFSILTLFKLKVMAWREVCSLKVYSSMLFFFCRTPPEKWRICRNLVNIWAPGKNMNFLTHKISEAQFFRHFLLVKVTIPPPNLVYLA